MKFSQKFGPLSAVCHKATSFWRAGPNKGAYHRRSRATSSLAWASSFDGQVGDIAIAQGKWGIWCRLRRQHQRRHGDSFRRSLLPRRLKIRTLLVFDVEQSLVVHDDGVLSAAWTLLGGAEGQFSQQCVHFTNTRVNFIFNLLKQIHTLIKYNKFSRAASWGKAAQEVKAISLWWCSGKRYL